MDNDLKLIFNFCKLKKDSPKDISDWLLFSFPKTVKRDNLISFLSKEEISIEKLFYYKYTKCVIFYFQIENKKSKKSIIKKISTKIDSPDFLKEKTGVDFKFCIMPMSILFK